MVGSKDVGGELALPRGAGDVDELAKVGSWDAGAGGDLPRAKSVGAYWSSASSTTMPRAGLGSNRTTDGRDDSVSGLVLLDALEHAPACFATLADLRFEDGRYRSASLLGLGEASFEGSGGRDEGVHGILLGWAASRRLVRPERGPRGAPRRCRAAFPEGLPSGKPERQGEAPGRAEGPEAPRSRWTAENEPKRREPAKG